MFGLLLMVFVREDHLNSVKRVHTVKIKTGTGGITANKGSTAIRFNYDDTSFLFLNCHLAHGENAMKKNLINSNSAMQSLRCILFKMQMNKRSSKIFNF